MKTAMRATEMAMVMAAIVFTLQFVSKSFLVAWPIDGTALLLAMILIGLAIDRIEKQGEPRRQIQEPTQAIAGRPHSLRYLVARFVGEVLLGGLSGLAVYRQVEELIPTWLALSLAILLGLVTITLIDLVWHEGAPSIYGDKTPDKAEPVAVTDMRVRLRNLLGLLVLALALVLLSPMLGFWPAMRALLGSIFLLLVPGYLLSQLLVRDEDTGMLERLGLSLALSVAGVGLTLALVNGMGVPISLWTTFSSVLGLILILAGLLILQRRGLFPSMDNPKRDGLPRAR